MGGWCQSSCINNTAGWLACSLCGSVCAALHPTCIEGTSVLGSALLSGLQGRWHCHWKGTEAAKVVRSQPLCTAPGAFLGMGSSVAVPDLLWARRAAGGDFVLRRIWVRSLLAPKLWLLPPNRPNLPFPERVVS